MRALRLGTRGSQLALWQAREVQRLIAAARGPDCEIVVIKTAGDRLQDRPLSDAGGKRLFVKEIEDALLAGDVDLAVHSSKDMAATLPDGLMIGGVLPREDPHDAVVLREAGRRADLLETIDHLARSAGTGGAASIGTGSIRRIAQLKGVFAGARFAAIRGNLDTRLRRLDEGAYDALVLAVAGLRRLGYASRISFVLPATLCLPAPGQGVVAIEVRRDDLEAQRAAAAVDDPPTAIALRAERALVEALGGGCQTPVGALARVRDGNELEMTAAVVAIDGERRIRGRIAGAADDAPGVGVRLARQLLDRGAGEILAEAQRAGDHVRSATMTDS
jgi:hydroxymethylbilane synthase